MASKATVQRQKSAEKVAAAGRTHNERIAEQVGARFGKAAGEAAATLVTAMIDDLEAKTAAMVRCDEAHEEELRDDPEVRALRDTNIELISDRLVESRAQLTVIYGESYTAKLGFSGATPTEPVKLLRLGSTVAENLVKVAPPEPKIPGYQMNPAQWREPIVLLTEQMKGVLEKIAAEEREAEATLSAKRAAIATYDAAFTAAADLVSTLLGIAGEKDLAKRVRPSSRRPGRTAEDAPAEGSTAAE